MNNDRRTIATLLQTLRSLPFMGLLTHVLFFTAIVCLLCIPQIQKLTEQNTILTESQAQAHIIEEATTANASGKKDTTNLLDHTILQTALLSEDQVVQFVEIFEQAAADTGVTQTIELTSSQRVVQRGVVHIPLQLTITGSWDGVMKFLAQIEHSGQYINMSAMTISPENTLSTDYTCTISAMTFWKQLL